VTTFEHRLLKLEKRVNRYRNLTVILGGLLTTVLTIGAVGNNYLPNLEPSDQIKQSSVPPVPRLGKRVDNAAPIQAIAEQIPARKATLQVSESIQTRRLDIVNSAGESVIILAPSVDGDGLIFVSNSSGKTLCYIGSSSASNNGLILVNSDQGKNIIEIGSNPDTKNGRINIRNKDEKGLIQLSAGDGGGELWITNEENNNLFYAGGSSDGNGYLELANKNGKRLITMFAEENENGSGNLWAYNNEDNLVAFLGTDIIGQGLLSVNSNTGTELVTVGSNTSDNGLLRVSNNRGNLGFSVVGADNSGILRVSNNQEKDIAVIRAGTNGNGRIDTFTPQGLRFWSTEFNQNPSGSGLTGKVGDLDGDGDIDSADFLIFSGNFGDR
jgi:hypothetical protein